jgi:hypothetical protein
MDNTNLHIYCLPLTCNATSTALQWQINIFSKLMSKKYCTCYSIFFITSQKKKRQVLNNSFFLYLLSKFTATMPKLSSSPHSIKAISYCKSYKMFDYEGAIKFLIVMWAFCSTVCSESHCAARLQYVDLVISRARISMN